VVYFEDVVNDIREILGKFVFVLFKMSVFTVRLFPHRMQPGGVVCLSR